MAFLNRYRKDMNGKGWIGVDLDGTLAYYEGFKGDTVIGNPIPVMMSRVKNWIKNGKTVKIFTARADSTQAKVAIKKWLEANGLPGLEITNVKDHNMTELWDDRCVQVKTNTGEPV